MSLQEGGNGGPRQAPVMQPGTPVKVSIFDGHVDGETGRVFGHGLNSEGECVYLVEMDNQQPPMDDKMIGTEQIRQGKRWVLSLYPDEVTQA